jgi:hypothetical protein
MISASLTSQPMNDSEPGRAASSELPQAETAPDAYMPMPRSSRAMMGCLVLPAVIGGLFLLLIACRFCLDAFHWVMSLLGQPSEKPKLDLNGYVLPIAFCIGPIWVFRAMLAETRKPWVYWLVVAWMTLVAAGCVNDAWFTITWPLSNSNIGPIVGQCFLTIWFCWMLCWFAFSKDNRRYYHLFKSTD